MNWVIKSFVELTSTEVYEILQLRNEVFVVEQNCPYQDADGKDFQGIHVLGQNDFNQLVAYCRILPIGLAYSHSASIGRVVNSSLVRGTGAGKKLMETAIHYAIKELKYPLITISAQSHLQRFYEELGFKRTDKKEYLEDDIPHREMELRATLLVK